MASDLTVLLREMESFLIIHNMMVDMVVNIYGTKADIQLPKIVII